MSGIQTSPTARHRSFAYPILLSLGALDAAGYSVIGPVAPAVSEATGAGPALIGVLVASFPLGIVIGFPLAGRAVQAWGPRVVLATSLGVIAAGCLGFVAGTGLPAYLASRLLMGMGSGGLWIGIALDTLERWPGQGYLCMSRILAAYSIGGLLGPALGAIGGIRGPFAAYLALVVVAIPLVFVMEAPAGRLELRADRASLRLPGFQLAAVGILFAVLGLGVAEGVLPLHFADRLSQVQIGALFVGMAAAVAVAATAAARFAPRRALAVSLVCVVIGIGLAGASDAVQVWIVSLVVAGVGIGAGNTGSIGVLLETVSSERIVTAMVVWSQIGIAGYLAGPLAGGALAESLGFSAVGLVPLAGAAVLLVALLRRRGAHSS
ncbi:MAG TPA: MFS transporter [Actinomycetota bacterium]